MNKSLPYNNKFKKIQMLHITVLIIVSPEPN